MPARPMPILGPMAPTPKRGLVPRDAVALACAAGVAVTLVSLLPVADIAYHSSTLHVAIETAATLIALLGAVLLVGRFARSPMRSELVLAGALVLLGLTNLCFSVIPWAIDEEPGHFHTWAPIAGRLIGAAGLALGALLPPEPVWRPRRALLRMLGGVAAALVVTGVGAALLAPHLPVGIDPSLPPDPSGPELMGEPALLVTQIVGMLLYAIAAVGFVRRAERTADELSAWLAAAATLAAFSRLNYFLFPSIYSEWVYAGDFLRLAFYALILAGALREITAYQRELAEVAVHRERRRIARELHDGLAQELAYISGQARRLGAGHDDPAARIADAAARALDESRQAIATLARPVNAPLDASVSQAAEEVAARDGIPLRLDLAPGLRAPDAVHDALTRIVREAVGNAIRHGDASSVKITLSGSEGVRLTVEDDGKGLPADAPNGRGFGLVSMRERAEALGGTLTAGPGDDGGWRVEATLPLTRARARS
jgi:signal transduction histidine kinase